MDNLNTWQYFLLQHESVVDKIVYLIIWTVVIGYIPFILCIVDDFFKIISFIKSLFTAKKN
ncbi:putative membrane protein [Candidatus Phytoplasma solani]|uniref:hypothetical protein n=1 Tax=Candidatus Phytoplasma solani TaxID=69896 RepID=UPI0032DB9EC7